MKVLLCSRVHPKGCDYNPYMSEEFDIIDILRFDEPIGRDMTTDYVLIPVDINVPCGDRFRNFRSGDKAVCGGCEYDGYDYCDVQKYTMGVWSSGGLFEVPKPIKHARYKIDWSTFISEETEALIRKKDKTDEERRFLVTSALANERPITEIEDKESG